MRPIIIGVTLGDPNGVGPEVAVRAAWNMGDRGFIPLLIGDTGVVARAASLSEPTRHLELRRLNAPEEALAKPGMLNVLDLPLASMEGISPGVLSANAGAACLGWLERAVGLAAAGRIDGIACAPANKEAMKRAGSPYSGQTAMIAALTGAPKTGTVLVAGAFRVFQTTSHVPLRKVFDLITEELVLDQVRLAKRVLVEDFGLVDPLLAVCGLNPHAGDGGILGDEEQRIITPALARARQDGIRVEGPLPGDAVFVKVRREKHDGIVAMYHDQANAVLKFMAVPVDVTLGLPIVRTTVAHGTAFDIAWQGMADAGCMTGALEVAAQLAWARRGRHH